MMHYMPVSPPPPLHSDLHSNPGAPAHGHHGSQQQQSVAQVLEDPVAGIKSQFVTREGVYKVMRLSEYSRPSRVPLNAQQTGGASGQTNAPVRVSFLRMPSGTSTAQVIPKSMSGLSRGANSEADSQNTNEFESQNQGRNNLSKPLDKRVYKGTCPTCHDFNVATATYDSAQLVIGFSAGQLQLIDPFKREPPVSKLFNEERTIDKTRVTCLKWVPGDEHHFLAAHSSGNMYLYHDELPCPPGPVQYQLFKHGDGYTIHTCKTKSSRNPVYKWTIGSGAIHEFAFSSTQEAKFLAVVSQDGFLRIFNYHAMELIGVMRSYFGGLLCCAWSPDAKYVATGGEDDLLTVYSVHEKRVVCRGHGHKSWIARIAFDAHTSFTQQDGTTMYAASAGVPIDLGSEEDLARSPLVGTPQASHFRTGLGGSLPKVSSGTSSIAPPQQTRRQKLDSVSSISLSCLCYRIGSVGHDTQLCLWDITEDVLKPQHGRLRTSTSHFSTSNVSGSKSNVAKNIALHEKNVNPRSTDVSPHRQAHSGDERDAQTTTPTPVDVSQSLNATTFQGANPATTLPNAKRRPFLLGRKKKDDEGTLPGDAHTIPKKALPLHKRGFSLGQKSGQGALSARSAGVKEPQNKEQAQNGNARLLTRNTSATLSTTSVPEDEVLKMLGTPSCPRLNEVPIIEPLVCKKIAHERLTVIDFREECIVTACQEGFICTWARPGKTGATQGINSPHGTASPTPVGHGGGTVV